MKLVSQWLCGKLNLTFGKYFTVIYCSFTSNRRFETSQNKIPPEKEFFGSSLGGFVLYRSSKQGICTATFYCVIEMLPYHKMPDNGCYFVLQRLINQRPEGAAAEQKHRGGEAKPAA